MSGDQGGDFQVLWPEPGEFRVLTEPTRTWLVQNGCDPACHACGCDIPVGQLWGLKESKLFVGEGIVVRGMICAPCFNAGRDISLDELQRRYEAAEKRKAEAEEAATATPATGAGCFLMPDGSMF